MKRLLAFILGGFLLCVFACGGGEHPATTKRGKEISNLVIKKATYQDVKEEYLAPGTVFPQNGARILSKVMGEIVRIYVKEGDRVKKGDILLNIDHGVYSARLRQAEAALSEAMKGEKAALMAVEEAKTGFLLAEKTYKRFLKLRQKGVVSEQKFDEVKAAFKRADAFYKSAQARLSVARASVRRARASVQEARVFLNYTRVRAPFSGRITKKMVHRGDVVSLGSPLFLMEYDDLYEVDCDVPSSYLRWIKIGERVRVKIGENVYIGKVNNVVLQGNSISRSYTVKVNLPSNVQVNPGMFAYVHFPLFMDKKLLVPKKAVVGFGQIKGIYTVEDSGRITFRIVRLGRMRGDFYEVLSGLKPGDRYIANPTPEVSDGDRAKGV